LKNGNTPKGRPFCRHTLPVFLAIHPGFLRQTDFIWQQNFSPLVIFPFFKQRLISYGRAPISSNILKNSNPKYKLCFFIKTVGAIHWHVG
jgi:hypothetical protein